MENDRNETRIGKISNLLSQSLIEFEALPKTFKIPQANDIIKVRDFPVAVSFGYDDSRKIARYFEFDKRQSSYYRDAAQGLGFVELDHRNKYKLTSLGEWYSKLNTKERNHVLVRRLAKHPIMAEILATLNKGQEVTMSDIEQIISKHSSLGGSTIPRRASTILSWYRWIEMEIGLISVCNGVISPNVQTRL
ncbi:MAG: AAA-associated domain-containing protein [Candidatus Thorarchaeota archaeon]|nr:AAA-associated domain-containing protein [Candidatus Thorarchaeota archaeon]